MSDSGLRPHNRLGIDYRAVPPRKVRISGGIVDIHTHTHNPELTRTFLAAADAYGISTIVTMCQLEDVDAMNTAYPGRFRYIAIPRWQDGGPTEAFISDWQRRLDAFYAKGSRLFKVHMAPGTKKRWGMHFEHPLIQRVIRHAYGLGYQFMTHVSDPKAWFKPGNRYDKLEEFGTFEDQFLMLDRLLEAYPDRLHLGAHMGGCLEDLPALASRMERFPQYVVDTSATKWIVRAIAEQDAGAVRDFIVRFQDRILFGSDLVVGEHYDFDHYASRYWVHLQQWETGYRGASPIEDPDAVEGHPQIAGLDLPAGVLAKLYRGNAERLILSL